MDNFKHLCPVCKEKGIAQFLQLRQINLNTAVYLCKDIRCIYPKGYSWIYEDRKLSDNDDDSDSDLSDTVYDDIEKMQLTISNTFDLNNSVSKNLISTRSVTKEVHNQEYQPLKYEDSYNTDHNYSERKTCKNVEDILYNTNIVLQSEVSEAQSCVGKNNRNVENIQLDKTETTPCDDATFVTTNEVENVIIDDPNELFSSLDLPCHTSAANQNYKILATGAENTEIVDIAVSNNIKPSVTQIKYEIVKDQTDSNTFKIDIKMPNKVPESKNVSNEKNIPVKKKKFVVLNAKTGGIRKLNEGSQIHSNKIKINLPHNICKIVTKPNTLQKINPNNLQKKDLSSKICGSVILNKNKNVNINNMIIISEKEVLPNLEKGENKDEREDIFKNNSDTKKAQTSTKNNSNENEKINSANAKIRDMSEDLALPLVDNESKLFNMEFKSLYKSTLKLHSKKEKPEYHFPKSVVEDAMKTLQEHADSDSTKKISPVKFNTRAPKKKAASSFKGFTFSTNLLKPTNSNVEKKKTLDQLELKDFLMASKRKKNKKALSKYDSDEDILGADISDSSNSAGSTDTSINIENKTNLGLGDLTLNELFDNINDVSAVDVPNSSADIAEVDEWLNSLCQ